MKILHCVPSLNIYGGAETIIKSLLCSSANAEVLEVYAGPPPKELYIRLFSVVRSMYKLWQCRKHYDVFHFHLFPAFYLSMVIPRCKVVIHEHNTHNRRRDIPILKYVEKAIYNRAKKIICISQASSECLNKWVGPLSNCVVLSNFTRFDYRPPSENEMMSIDEMRFFNILMVASLSEQKRHQSLLDSVPFLPSNYVVHLLGDGPLRERLEQYAAELNISDRVFFHGNVSNVSEFYSKADLCVLLSNWEGFGLVVVEAASFNKISLCSNVPGLSDVVNRGELLISNDISCTELAKVVVSTVENYYANHGEYVNYCKSLTHRYSFAGYCRQLDLIYGDLLS